jgi:hypothetical protein
VTSAYNFLPWVREGAVSVIGTKDTLDATLYARVRMDVNVQVNASPAVARAVRLYGPGDVTGFDARQVVRTEPRHLATDFEPNYFPAVEFDRPDFPWLFTPAAANDQQQLRPWICLVVVPKREGVKLDHEPTMPLPVLTIDEDAGTELPPSEESWACTELPPLEESWAWAHAQVTGAPAPGQTLAQVIADSQQRTVSRLVCPRELEPNTAYYACVVPAFEAGRKAGLGLPVSDAEKLEPAWRADSDKLPLPIYYHWEFVTGAAGDFESLVWLLEPRRLPPEVGRRTVDAGKPGSGLPSAGMLGLEGALRSRGQGSPGLGTVPQGFRDALKTLLERPEVLSSTDPTGELAVAPPLYGRWHAARRTVPEDPERWLRELNLDPRYRAAAGFGTRVVQDQQEQLMASAWEQVGEIERANQLLRQAQLARSAGDAIHSQRLGNLPAATLLQVAGPVHARSVMGTEKTLDYQVRESTLPETAVLPAFRRLTRPNGPLMRRLGGGARRADSLVRRLNQGEITAAPQRGAPGGVVTLGSVRDAQGTTRCFIDSRLQSECSGVATDAALDQIEPADQTEALFKEAALAHQRDLMKAYGLTREPQPKPKPKPLPLEEVREALLAQLDPETTVCKRVRGRLALPGGGWQHEDCLEPIMAAPEFPTPMYKALAELSRDLLLPGLEHVPPNTIALLETNAKFVEAYMVGLNHEMSRELLWREYPTDQRGTYFRQFWDPRGHVPPPATEAQREALKDMPPIHEWGAEEHLGGNLTGGGTKEQSVLLIRGDLLRRYPNATICTVEAKWTTPAGGKPFREPVQNPTANQERYAIFSGTLVPDITFLGFDLGVETARGDQDASKNLPGWFFMIQQQPTEPRHGLEALAATTPQTSWTWRDLSWVHVQKTAGGYARVGAPLQNFPDLNDSPPSGTPSGVKWAAGSNAAALAYITLQQPFRVAVHASDMLPE